MALKEKKKLDKKSEEVLKEMEKISKDEKKKDNKSDKKKEEKKDNKKEEKNVVKKESWWHGVKSEFKKVRWPSKKEMIKYSIATIIFIIFFSLFFYLIELIIWLIQKA